MKYLEYAPYDIDFDENEIKANIESAKTLNINCVSVPYYYTKFCRSILKDSNIIVGNSVDYPLGLSDTKSRNSSVINAITNGAQKIELVMQNNFLSNRKYDKIRLDIKSNLDICKDNNVGLYYYLEYRVFTHQSLIKACEILREFDIQTVYPSTGHMLDSLEDNLVATVLLNQKTDINTIFSGNVWTKEHIKKLKNSHINKFRASSLTSLELLASI